LFGLEVFNLVSDESIDALIFSSILFSFSEEKKFKNKFLFITFSFPELLKLFSNKNLKKMVNKINLSAVNAYKISL
jgi:hypothetical protein